MKANKFSKFILVALCFIITASWMEIQGMEEIAPSEIQMLRLQVEQLKQENSEIKSRFAYEEKFSLVIARCSILDMNGCNIGDAKRFSEQLKNNQNITQVQFQSSKIDDVAISYLSEAFETLPNLAHIYLYDNKIGNAGAIKLFLSLKEVKSLKSLDIRNNMFDSDVLPELSALLRKNEKFTLGISFINFKNNIII
jgi:hypothetical protein